MSTTRTIERPAGAAGALPVGSPFLLRWLAVLAMTGAWPVLRTATQLPDPGPWTIRQAAASIVASLVVTALAGAGGSGPSVLLWWVVAALPTYAVTGKVTAVWVLAASAIALWGAVGVVPSRRVPVPRPDVAPLLIAAGVLAGVLGRHRDDWIAPSLLAAAVVVIVLGIVRPGLPHRLTAWIDPLARGLGAIVRLVALSLVAVLVIVVPWAAQRLLRWDPLWAGHGSSTRWIRRGESVVDGDQRWFVDPVRPTLVRRWHSVLVAAAIAGSVVGIVQLSGAIVEGREQAAQQAAVEATFPPIQKELYDQPWFDGLSEASADMYDRSRLSQYVGSELPDVTSESLNIADGRRRTWSPPERACPRRVVWMFGGSALFGVGQRDDHTVSSELARLAAAEGLDLDVSNWGVPGDVAWQQLRRLERALLDDDLEPPDLVVFYDGFNDVVSAAGNSGAEWALPGQFAGPLDRLHMRLLGDLQESIAKDQSERLLQAELTPSPPEDERRGEALARWQYDAADELTRRVLGTYDVPFLHVTQPMLGTRTTPLPEEPEVTEVEREQVRAFVDSLPDEVVDLSAAPPGPAFVDAVHLTEEANRTVARRLLPHVRSALPVAGDGEVAPCS